jgi:hypothetical protein
MCRDPGGDDWQLQKVQDRHRGHGLPFIEARSWLDDDDSVWRDGAIAPAMGMALGMNHTQLVMPETTGDLADDTPARLRLLLHMGSTCLVNRCAAVRIGSWSSAAGACGESAEE